MTQDSVTINQCIIKLIFDRPLSLLVKPKDLRGAMANLKKDNVLFHQHANDGTLIYNYPLIQYKIIKGNGFIVGLWKGAVDVVNALVLKKRLSLGNEEYIVEQQEMSFWAPSIGFLDRRREYKFLTPWLGLNEKNYEKYQRLGAQVSRKEMLERILVGNIISMSKGLGYTVPGRIMADIRHLGEIHAELKGTPMLGFLGTFSVNFEIPDYWGIGKSVSRGFGTVVRD
ncbi:MAG: hypothetical protein KAV83_00730 [Desulfobacterales bacterium]|nr:hypothetical protein [Desulfobacterales bacterium]